MSQKTFWKLWLILGSFVGRSIGQGCECASTEWFNSEPMPGLFVQYTCPEWPAELEDMPIPGTFTELKESTGFLFLQNSFVNSRRGKNFDLNTVAGGKSQECTGSYLEQQPSATGWNIILLNNWMTVEKGLPERLQNGAIAKMDMNVIFPVREDLADAVLLQFENRGSGTDPEGLPVAIPSYPFFYNYLTRSAGSAGDAPYTIRTTDLLNDISETLKENSWGDFIPGMVRTEGGLYPALFKQFGSKQRVYAYYGSFTDGEQAGALGYSAGQPLYFTRPSVYPPVSSEFMTSGLRYGAEIYTSPLQVVSDRDKFEWYTECRCSLLDYEPDQDNNPTVSRNGNWTPISPSNIEQNRNLLQVQECPDNIQYAILYEKCVESLFSDDDIRANPKERTDYRDYLASKMGETPAWKSELPDGTIESEALSIDNMPETPAYYDHTGARLNPISDATADPLDPETDFTVRSFRGGILGIGEEEFDRNVSGTIRPVILSLASIYNDHVARGKDGILSLFDLLPTYSGEDMKFQAEYGDGIELTLTIDDPSYFHLNWVPLNTQDKYLPFRSPQIFITQSTTGRPIRIKVQDDNWVTREYAKFDLLWAYDLFIRNSHGDPFKVGSFKVKKYIHYNWDHVDWSPDMTQVKIKGENKIAASDTYDLTSREAHTDLRSLNERDPESFDKTSAMAKIAYYIAVSEGLDMAMKWVYQQRDKPYAYEAAKRFDNMSSTKMSKKLAISLYKGYVEWKRLMDILRDIRDTRRSMERSFSRFKKAGRMLFDYYTNLDYSSIRPTNITVLYPSRAVRYFDYTADNLAYDIRHFELSVHALALDLDRFLAGPGKSTVAYMQREFLTNLSTVDGENERQRQANHAALQGATKATIASDETNSNYIRLSALTKLAIQKTNNFELKSLQASTSGLRNVLTAIQSDSRDWITMGDYVTENIAGTPDALRKSFKDRDPKPIREQMRVGTIFNNKWVDEELGEAP